MDKNSKKNTKSKRPNKISSSGREIKKPKHLITTSEEEVPGRSKKLKISVDVKSQIEHLKATLSDIEKKKDEKNKIPKSRTDVSKNSREESPSRRLMNSPVQLTNISDTSNKFLNESVYGANQLQNSSTDSPKESSCSFGTSVKTLRKPSLDTSIKEQPSAMRPSITVRNIQILKPSEEVDLNANQEQPSISRPSSQLAVAKVRRILEPPQEIYVNNNPAFHADTKRVLFEQREISRNVDSNSNDVLNRDEISFDINDNEETFETAPTNCLKSILEIVKNIEKQYEVIVEQNKKILSRLPDTNVIETRLGQSLYGKVDGFPLNTIDEFKQVDSIENKETRTKVYKHLLQMGGAKVRDFLSAAFKKVMTDELATHFTWRKSHKTKEFENTRVANVLFQAAKDCPLFQGPNTKVEFKEEMLEVLRASKQRYRKTVKNTTDAESVRREIERLQGMIEEEETPSDSEREEDDEEFADDELE